jgi:hypothetical protein
VLNLFSLFAGGLSRYFQSRSDETRLRWELLAHRRRQLLHQHIPDAYSARDTFGARFDELHLLLVKHDPGSLKKLAADSPFYPELARTLLYQLPQADSEEKVLALVQQEVHLWFGQRLLNADVLPALASSIYQWDKDSGTGREGANR